MARTAGDGALVRRVWAAWVCRIWAARVRLLRQQPRFSASNHTGQRRRRWGKQRSPSTTSAPFSITQSCPQMPAAGQQGSAREGQAWAAHLWVVTACGQAAMCGGTLQAALTNHAATLNPGAPMHAASCHTTNTACAGGPTVQHAILHIAADLLGAEQHHGQLVVVHLQQARRAGGLQEVGRASGTGARCRTHHGSFAARRQRLLRSPIKARRQGRRTLGK